MKKVFLAIVVLWAVLTVAAIPYKVQAAPSDYYDTVQKTYIGYYQRAADPGGLIYWAGRLNASGGNLTDIIEAFANSTEAQALYGTISSSNISNVVNSIYNTLFGRSAEAGGLSYYVNGFNSGQFTAATIMLNVLYGAQNEDLWSVNNKVTAANLFTRTIDPELDGSNFQVTYAGDGDVIAGRDFLNLVTWDSATVPTQDETTAYIQTNIADPGDAIGFPSPTVLESTSQTITAAQGGTITLPGGSSVTIPAGALASDQTVRLSLVSSLPKQPPSGMVVGVGPALSLSFSTNQPFLGTTQTQGLLFILKYGSTTPAGLVGSAPVADIVDDDNFAGLVSLSCDPNSTCTVLPISALQSFPITSGIYVSAVNLRPPIERTPIPTPGAKSWNGTNWVDGVGPLNSDNKCVLLVHGMNSQVEEAFGDRNTVELIKRAGGYNCVLGFDYDWTKGIDDSGGQLASFLSSLHIAHVNPIDIVAHSEGGPVSLSGACQNQDMPIANMVMLGSPVTGTPAATLGSLGQSLADVTLMPLATTLYNLTTRYGVPQLVWMDVLNGQFAPDLQPGSAVLAHNNQCVANKMAEPLSNLATTHLTCVGGSDYTKSSLMSVVGTLLEPAIFGNTSNDGFVGNAVAQCEGAGFDPSRVTPLTYPLSHTMLTSDWTVIDGFGDVVSAHPYVPILIFRGTAVITATASDPNSPTSDWYHCLPDPIVITETAGPFTVDLVLDANPLVLGPISGTLYEGSSTITGTTPESTCTRIGEGYPRVWTVPATTITETVPSYSGTISGHSDGTNIVIDTSIDLPSYCSETFTGTVTTAPVTGIVHLSGQDIVTCIENGVTVVVTTTYSLTRQ
jgi:pimeloyl-ACP methyl ester carboxylesterase